jgi:hypothetical protein
MFGASDYLSTACLNLQRFPVGSPADPPLPSMLEVAQTQPQPFCSVAGSHESPLLAHASLQGPGLSRSYGLGIFRGDKGTVEFNRKTRTLAVEQNGVRVRTAIA